MASLSTRSIMAAIETCDRGGHGRNFGEDGAAALRNAVFEAAPHGYLILDPDFNIIDVNRQYLDLTGARRESLVGLPLFEAFPDKS